MTMSASGESMENGNSTEKSSLPLEMIKIKEKSTENVVLDNRLPLEPPDLIPKITNLNRKSSSVQDVRDNNARKYDYNRFSNERYRLLPTYNNSNINNINNNNRVSCENIRLQNDSRLLFGLSNDIRTISEDNLDNDRFRKSLESNRTVSNKYECDFSESLDEKRNGNDAVYQSKDQKTEKEVSIEEENPKPEVIIVTEESEEGVSFSVRGVESQDKVSSPKEKSSPLQRVQEKRLGRTDSTKSLEGKVERSTSLKLVERSTSFGRTDTMKIVQKPESNVNSSMSDAFSQTDLLEEDGDLQDETACRNMEEELEYERLSRDLASQLSPSDKLQGLLAPASERKKSSDYVAGLFRLDVSSRPRRNRKLKSTESMSSNSSGSPEHSLVNGILPETNDRLEPLPSSSPYFTTSESKAKMLTRYTENMDSLGLSSTMQLQQKKEELMARLDRKLEILREEQVLLSEECTANDELGNTVSSCVSKVARPHEVTKYRLHVEEVGKITSLLLGLSGRLARAENALLSLPSHHDERKIHESKRDKLQEQLTEAKQLKENIDKRSDAVSKILSTYLTRDEYADYHHFIHMKAKLIVDSREIADKISLGEEQLAALKETLSS